MPLGTQLRRPGSNSKQELEIAVKICASLRGAVAASNMQKEFSLGEFNEQASPESRLPLYGKACKFVGFVTWFCSCPLCGTVVFRTVGRRSNCIFVFVYNSLVSILGLGAQLKTLLAGELGAGWRAEGATISFTVAL